MIRAYFSPRASADLDQICSHIAEGNPDAAQWVRRTILDLADFLAQNPGLGRRIAKASSRHVPTRWFVVPKFRNYLVFYQPFKESIIVIRILHGAQDWARYFSVPTKTSG
jgi:plasmid stabilization system protein ParE